MVPPEAASHFLGSKQGRAIAFLTGLRTFQKHLIANWMPGKVAPAVLPVGSYYMQDVLRDACNKGDPLNPVALGFSENGNVDSLTSEASWW